MIPRIGVYPGWIERHPAELRVLEDRAAALDVMVSTHHLDTRHEPDGYWRVRVRRGEKVTTLRARGRIGTLIAAALEDWDLAYGERWTADELLTVAAQSGLEVRRA